MSDDKREYSIDEIIAESKSEEEPQLGYDEAEITESEYYDNYDSKDSEAELRFDTEDTEKKKKKK